MSEDGKKIFFRNNLVGGFNRADVIDYIARQSREQIKACEDLKTALDDYEAENTALNDRLTALSAEADDLRARLALRDDEIRALNARLAEEEARTAAADAKLDSLLDELSETSGAVLDSDTCEELSDSRKIDELSRRVAELTRENSDLIASIAKLNKFKNNVKCVVGSRRLPQD